MHALGPLAQEVHRAHADWPYDHVPVSDGVSGRLRGSWLMKRCLGLESHGCEVMVANNK